MIPFLVILTIFVGGVLAIYWVAKPSYERRRVENSTDEVRVVEHPPGYYMPQWKPAGFDWWIDLEDDYLKSLTLATTRAKQQRDWLEAKREPARIHKVDEEGGDK